MRGEPGAQDIRPDAPASPTEQIHGDRDAAATNLRVQILSTEHWSLLATRSMTWNEAFARAQMFLSVLSATVISLALVAQATSFGTGFTTFALVLLPVVLFLGLTTFIRLVAVNNDELRWVIGMNRIRAAYLELAPELERYFITSHHDDERGVMATAGWTSFPTLGRYVTTPALVGVVDAVVAGVLVFLAADALGAGVIWAAAVGFFTFSLLNVWLSWYMSRSQKRAGAYRPINPYPQ